MSEPRWHAEMSAKRFGGKSEDYVEIHELMDSSGSAHSDVRHRFATHNIFFVKLILPRIFGKTITNSDGKKVSVVEVGEWHLLEDFHGSQPTLSDWASNIDFQKWMNNGQDGERPPSHEGLPSVDEDELYLKKGTSRIPDANDPDQDHFERDSGRGCNGVPGMVD